MTKFEYDSSHDLPMIIVSILAAIFQFLQDDAMIIIGKLLEARRGASYSSVSANGVRGNDFRFKYMKAISFVLLAVSYILYAVVVLRQLGKDPEFSSDYRDILGLILGMVIFGQEYDIISDSVTFRKDPSYSPTETRKNIRTSVIFGFTWLCWSILAVQNKDEQPYHVMAGTAASLFAVYALLLLSSASHLIKVEPESRTCGFLSAFYLAKLIRLIASILFAIALLQDVQPELLTTIVVTCP